MFLVSILNYLKLSLKALTAPKVDSRLVYNGVQALNKLGKYNKELLVWIPGHEGFIGNEKADELARGGSTNYLVGPEPFVGLSQGTIISAFKTYAKTKHQHEWRNQAGLRQWTRAGLTNSGNLVGSNSESY
jgi:hypothetical protein